MTGLGSNYASVESAEKMNANFELYLSRSSSVEAALQCVSINVHLCVYGKCPDSLLKTARLCSCFSQGLFPLFGGVDKLNRGCLRHENELSLRIYV